MNKFELWTHSNLAKFAAESMEKMKQQEQEIQRLREDLRAALDAYRGLLRKTSDA